MNNGNPVENVNVKLYDDRNSQVQSYETGNDGKFIFKKLQEGKYKLEYENCSVDKIESTSVDNGNTITSIALVLPDGFDDISKEEIEGKFGKGSVKEYRYNEQGYKIKNYMCVDEVGYEITKNSGTINNIPTATKKFPILNILNSQSPAEGGWICDSNDDFLNPSKFYTTSLFYNGAENIERNKELFTKWGDEFFSYAKATEEYKSIFDRNIKIDGLQNLIENIVNNRGGKCEYSVSEIQYNNDKTDDITIAKLHDNFNTTNIVTTISGINNSQPNNNGQSNNNLPTGGIKGTEGSPPTNNQQTDIDAKPDHIIAKISDDNRDPITDKKLIYVYIEDGSGNILGHKTINETGTTGSVYWEVGEENDQIKLSLGETYNMKFVYGVGKYNWQDYKTTDEDDTDIRANLNSKEIDKALYAKYNEMESKQDIQDSSIDKEYLITAIKSFKYNGGDRTVELQLKKRDPVALKLDKKLTKAKITLQDGSVLREEDYTNDVYEDVPAYWYIDDEIMLGATITLEYGIKITSNIELTDIKILDYLSYDNSNLVFDQNARILSKNNVSNSDQNWNKIDASEANDVRKNSTLTDENIYLLNDTGKTLAMSGENVYECYLVVSKLVTPSDDNLTYDNLAEVVSYKNEDGKIAENNNNKLEPGNLEPSSKSPMEVDSDKAKQFIVTKPTGLVQKKIKNIFFRMKEEY